MGCRGPTTYNACASIGWNENTSFPIRSGHGCIGCSEDGFWDRGPFYERLPDMQQWGIESNADKVAAIGAGALGAAVAVQAGATLLQRITRRRAPVPKAEDNKEQGE
jgi:hydrogenase small subunit